MSLQVTGKITKFLNKQTGTSKKGKDWVKQSFILDNNEKYNNIFCFEVFGEENVTKLEKYNKVGDTVTVDFNVSTNEYQGKYYVSLSAWRVFKADLSDDNQKKVLDLDESGFEHTDALNDNDLNDLPF